MKKGIFEYCFGIDVDEFLVEWPVGELLRQTARITKARADACKATLVDEDLDALVWEYHVRCSDGEPRGWNSLYKIDVDRVKEEKIMNPEKWHILVFCECPAFTFWGSEYLAKRNRYLYGKPMGTATMPRVNTVLGPGTSMETSWVSSLVCKHIIAVLPELIDLWKRKIKEISEKIFGE